MKRHCLVITILWLPLNTFYWREQPQFIGHLAQNTEQAKCLLVHAMPLAALSIHRYVLKSVSR